MDQGVCGVPDEEEASFVGSRAGEQGPGGEVSNAKDGHSREQGKDCGQADDLGSLGIGHHEVVSMAFSAEVVRE